MSVILLSKLSR